MFFINGFTYANWVARLPRIQEHYGLDNGGIGIMLLMTAVGALLAMPFTGWVIVRYGSRQVTRVAAVLFLGWVALLPLAPATGWLTLIFFGMGLAAGTMDVAMNAQAVLVEQAYRRPIMASFHAVFSAGMMLGAACGALFTRLGVDLLPHLLIIVSAGLVLAVISSQQLVFDRVQGPAETGNAFRWPSRSLVGIGLIAFCCMLGEGAMADWSTNYLERVAGAGQAIAPLGLAAFSLAMMTGRFFGDYIRARLGDRRLLINSSLTATAGLMLALLLPEPTLIIAGFFLVGLGLATIVPIAYSTAGNAPGLAPGVGISMVTTIGYTGFLFGPPIIGFLADWQGLRLALALVLLLFLLMSILSARLSYGRPERERQAGSPMQEVGVHP